MIIPKIFQTIGMRWSPRGFSSIIRLFFWCCPITVFWTIISIIINSIYCMNCRWFSTHIKNKIRKGIFPTITNFYSSTTIRIIPFVFFIITSLFHEFPRIIFRRMSKPMSSSGVPTFKKFFKNTSTTFCVTIFNRINSCYKKVTTKTFKFPKCSIWFLSFMMKFNGLYCVIHNYKNTIYRRFSQGALISG